MKILRIVGIVLAAAGLGLIVWGMTLGNPGCETAEQYGREADEAYEKYEAAKARGASDSELYGLELDGNRKVKAANEFQDICANNKSSKRLFLTLFAVLAGVGILLTVLSFFVGRKPSPPQYPYGPRPPGY